MSSRKSLVGTDIIRTIMLIVVLIVAANDINSFCFSNVSVEGANIKSS